MVFSPGFIRAVSDRGSCVFRFFEGGGERSWWGRTHDKVNIDLYEAVFDWLHRSE